MSFAGHVLAMIQTMRNNRNLVHKRDKLFTGLNKRISKNYRHHTKQQKKMSAEQLEALRSKLIKENRQLFVKKVIVLSLVIGFIVVFFLWLNNAMDLNVINERYGF
ncbi:hypothetical protein [Carboxylicivirga marina]|uniref:Uncharacterized protein n=1 Tax=Carboxylicivirga marina TaxID=2800988 RepID=A0ABS1HLS7_9BACT|nr:hypothetical protein [Carboxylicivirga marina]MBK3518634.1 hypothetical protein [Carboxylicivirga marina]